MSGPNRTFVLQAVAVAVLVGFVFFAFLWPSDQEEIAGIQAPGDDGPSFATPPSIKDDRAKRRLETKRERRPEAADDASLGAVALRNRAGGTTAGSNDSTFGLGPTDDQYTDTASALMFRVRAEAP